jgi:very-short-patch-repair endonuclease
MDPVDALRAFGGGSARYKKLAGAVSRRALNRACSEGRVLRSGKTYYLEGSDRHRVLAVRLRAVRSHVTAAAHHRLALPPGADDKTHLTVPWKARRTRVPDAVTLHYRDLPARAVDGDVTTLVQTVVDCLRDEPLRTALSVGDSALAQGRLTRATLRSYAARLRGPGSARVRRRIELLDGRTANAFESCARAILIEAGLVGFEPQVSVRHRGTFIGRVDLAHRRLRIVIECDGHEFHSDRDSWVQDVLRHTSFVAAGWRPLRFTWQQVMFSPGWVLERVVETITGDDGARALSTAQRVCSAQIAAA